MCARHPSQEGHCFAAVTAAWAPKSPPLTRHCSNPHIEEEIGRLRAELLRKDQENERMQTQLAAEKEERERAQRKVGAAGVGGTNGAGC